MWEHDGHHGGAAVAADLLWVLNWGLWGVFVVRTKDDR